MVLNTPKKFYLVGPLWDELTSEYYNENIEAFGLLFRQYTASDVDNVYHSSIVNERKANKDKASTQNKHSSGVYIPYEINSFSQSTNVDHFPKWLLNGIE